MPELILEFLSAIMDSEIIESALLIISDDILVAIAFDEASLSIVYEEIVETLEVFQQWMAKTLGVSLAVVNVLFGLQMLYNLIYSHYQTVESSRMCISVSVALQDMEGTLKKNYNRIIAAAQKEILSPAFSKLSPDVQNQFRNIVNQTPMQYWLSVKEDIMHALLKMPIYAK
jgi:hypothetical protein